MAYRCWNDHGMSQWLHYVKLFGSRSKTHARHSVSERHLQIWMCVFDAVAKDSERAAKGSRKV